MRLAAVLVLALSSAAPYAADSEAPEPLAQYAGKVVYVDFWASWCGPCAQSFPWLNTLQGKFGPDLLVVGVGVDSDPADGERFLREHPAQFVIVTDPAGRLAEHYAIDGMPAAVVLDRRGRMVHRHSGFRQAEIPQYEAALRRAVRSGAAAGGAP